MRIAYGVHGYSRGHATRAAAVLGSLRERHEVRIYAGGDAHDFLSRSFPVERIPCLGFAYNRHGQMSKAKTFFENLPKALDLFRSGPEFSALLSSMRGFQPDIVISDAEPWTHRAALALGVPRIGFDHFGIMVYCRVPLGAADQVRSAVDRALYYSFIGKPDRALVSSFYDVPPRDDAVRVVGPLLRDEVHRVQPHSGDHLLVYLNRGVRQLTGELERAFQALPLSVRLYGAGRVGQEGNITFRPPGNLSFLRDLAGCRAVVSTAGNQLVGEAIHYGKPMLVAPEATVEQRMNAAAVERMGIGEATTFAELDAARIGAFLGRVPELAAATRRHRRDGRREALGVLEQWMAELVRGQGSPASVGIA